MVSDFETFMTFVLCSWIEISTHATLSVRRSVRGCAYYVQIGQDLSEYMNVATFLP